MALEINGDKNIAITHHCEALDTRILPTRSIQEAMTSSWCANWLYGVIWTEWASSPKNYSLFSLPLPTTLLILQKATLFYMYNTSVSDAQYSIRSIVAVSELYSNTVYRIWKLIHTTTTGDIFHGAVGSSIEAVQWCPAAVGHKYYY